MAGSKSAYLEAALLDLVFGAGDFVPPSSIWVALSTSPFSASDTGSAMDEVTAGDYARQELVNNTTNWPAASGAAPATKATGSPATFPTATSDWGTVQSVYLLDASSGGNVLYGGDLSAGVPINTGSGFTIPAGQYVLTET